MTKPNTQSKTPVANRSGKVVTLAYSALVRDKLNVRKKTPGKAAIAEMAESLHAHGLLQNIIVRKLPGGTYGVVAGWRRKLGFDQLVKRGDFAKTGAIACRIVSDDEAVEISLAENIHREDMHVADEIAAWGALAKAGMTTDEIANRHGTTAAQVEKRFALGALSPVLLKALRNDEFGLQVAMVFTLAADQKEQEAVYASLTEGGRSVQSWQVREAILKQEVKETHALAVFVGKKAYEAAGGTFRRDLFAEEVYFQDRALLNKLLTDKMASEIVQLEAAGWSWIEFIPQMSFSEGSGMRRFYAKSPSYSKDEKAALAAAEEQLEELEMDGKEDMPIAQRIRKKIAKIEKPETWAKKNMAIGGGFITVNNRGEIRHELGFIRPQDDPLKKAEKKEPAAPKKGAAAYAKGLCDDLALPYRTALRCELMKQPEIAEDLLKFEMVRAFVSRSEVLNISARNPDGKRIYGDAGMMGTFTGEKALEDAIAGVALDWIEEEDTAKAFATFRALPGEDKTRIMAFVAQQTLLPVLPDDDGTLGALEQAKCDMGFDPSAYYQPDETFFARLQKSVLLGIGAAVISSEWKMAHLKEKKPVIVSSLSAAFGTSDKFSDDVKARAAAWCPAPLVAPVAEAEEEDVAAVAAQ